MTKHTHCRKRLTLEGHPEVMTELSYPVCRQLESRWRWWSESWLLWVLLSWRTALSHEVFNSQDYKHSQTTEACAAYAKCPLCSDTLSWTHRETVVEEMCELRLDAVSQWSQSLFSSSGQCQYLSLCVDSKWCRRLCRLWLTLTCRSVKPTVMIFTQKTTVLLCSSVSARFSVV